MHDGKVDCGASCFAMEGTERWILEPSSQQSGGEQRNEIYVIGRTMKWKRNGERETFMRMTSRRFGRTIYMCKQLRTKSICYV
jgi:hypothetical protein